MSEQQVIQEGVEELGDKAMTAKRPGAITAVCVIGLVGALVTVPLIFSPIAGQVGAWYPPYLAASVVVGAVCLFGLWTMKKWGAYGYSAFVGINQLVLLAMGAWNVMALVLPGIVVAIGLRHVGKMS